MTSDSSHRGSICFYRGRQWDRSGFKFVYSFCVFRIFQSRRATAPRKRAPSSTRSRACKRFATRTPRRSSQKPVTKHPTETTSNPSTWHAGSWDRPARSANGAAKAIPRRLRSLTSTLALPLYHGQFLDALFRLACNRPRNFTIGAVGSLRFKRRDNAITQHIDARFSRPATLSHGMPQFNKSARSTASSRFFSPTYKPLAVVSSG